MLAAGTIAGLLVVLLAVLLHGPAPQRPYRTPAVKAALEQQRPAATPGQVVSLTAVPQLALPATGLGETKLAFAPLAPPSAPPVPSEAPAERAEAMAAARPALRPLPESGSTAPSPATAAPVQPAALVRPPAPAPHGRAELAIVIDDLGLDLRAARRAIDLPVGVTLSFLPYGYDLDRLTAAAAARGHDVFLHLPMEPQGSEDPGPNALLTGLEPQELGRRLTWAFARVPRAVGVNNHMGSRATADPRLMLTVLQEVRRRGLVFVDSRTTPLSVAAGIAEQLGLPHVARNVFLDNEPNPAAIRAQLGEAERVARRHGGALAIGHPFAATLAVLAEWLPDAQRRGLRIVSARDLIADRGCTVMVASTAAPPAC